MKWIKLALVLVPQICFGVSIQLGAGSLTPHFPESKKNYCNQWNNTGIIANKTYYFRFQVQKIGVTYMQGNDSICSDIEGLFVNYRFTDDGWWDIGLMLGGYAYDPGAWEDHARDTPGAIDAPDTVSIDYFGRAVVPVVALEVGIRLVKRDNWSVRLNNLFTPIIFNHSLAWEYSF